VLVVAACTESPLPTESWSELKPRLGAALGECASPFVLSGASDADAQAADKNGDGYACYLTDRQDEKIILIWTDNNVPLSQLGGCPNGFVLMKAPATKPGDETDDRNGDGYVCTRTASNGSTLTIDNTHR
jgi:hypothetical protein